MRRALSIHFTLLLALLPVSCSGESGEAAGAAPAPPAPAVVVATITTADVPIVRDFVARTEAVETVSIQARVEAILESLEFEEGSPVKRGQVLYRLDDRTFRANLASAEAALARGRANLKLAREQVSVRSAEAALAQAGAQLEKAQQDVARLRPLAEKDAVPRQDLDTALAAEKVAVAEVEAKEAGLKNSRIMEEVGILQAEADLKGFEAQLDLAKLDLGYCTIASPVDGLIGRTEVSVGNLVGRGSATQLAVVSTVDPMYATFAISEDEYLRTVSHLESEGRAAESVQISLILSDDSVYRHPGVIQTAEREVDLKTGTLQLVTRFPNPEGQLRPGQFGRLRVRAATLKGAVLVPQRAVAEQQSAKVVLVVGADDKVSLRVVKVGMRHENYFVVTEGLEVGERVVVEGQMKARPGMTVKPTDRPVSREPSGEGD